MKKNLFLSVIMLSFLVCTFNGCKKPDKASNGKVTFKFTYLVNGDSMVKNVMKYVNAAGNHYEITNLQWFLSDVTFYRKGEAPLIISKSSDITFGIHYVDTDIPSTSTWNPDFDVPEGNYDSITFVFGLDATTNQSGIFRNNPEAAMFWPDMMGGGYHYMKFNGYYLDSNSIRKAFNFHLGIGQIYSTDTTFVQNYFTVSLPQSAFNLQENKTKEIQIVMSIEKWFQNPVFDFDVWGASIMDKQNALAIACKNGRNVFSIGYIKDIQ